MWTLYAATSTKSGLCRSLPCIEAGNSVGFEPTWSQLTLVRNVALCASLPCVAGVNVEGYEVEELTPPTKAGAIKALTLYQPWATLVAIGAKRIETRSWWTAYRGLLAIHASKTFGATNRALCHQEPFRSALLAGGVERLSDLPLGAVVCFPRETQFGSPLSTLLPPAVTPPTVWV